MKKIKSLVGMTICAGALSLTGCTADKTPIDAEEFVEEMKEDGLTINDQSEAVAPDLDTKEVQVAFEEGKYQIEFYVFNEEEKAKSVYNSMKKQLEDTYGNANGATQSSKSVGNHGSYKLSAEGNYFVVSRIENTLIYSATTKEYKDTVKDLIEDLGY